jgi:hypothetical protein
LIVPKTMKIYSLPPLHECGMPSAQFGMPRHVYSNYLASPRRNRGRKIMVGDSSNTVHGLVRLAHARREGGRGVARGAANGGLWRVSRPAAILHAYRESVSQ